jgi:hypothetical protein
VTAGFRHGDRYVYINAIYQSPDELFSLFVIRGTHDHKVICQTKRKRCGHLLRQSGASARICGRGYTLPLSAQQIESLPSNPPPFPEIARAAQRQASHFLITDSVIIGDHSTDRDNSRMNEATEK